MHKLARLLVAAALVATPLVAAPTAHAAPATAHCTAQAGAVKVESDLSPATVSVLDTRTGDMVDVVVTITGSTFEVTAVDPDVVLTDASWCVKSSTKTNSGTGTDGASTSTNKKGKVQDISYVLLYSVTSEDPTPVAQCNDATSSGGQGVTITPYEIGTAGPATFTVSYQMYSIPDKLEVFYEGALVATTGDVVSGSATLNVALPAGTATTVDVVVTGPYSGTAWDYTLHCPAP